MRITTRIGVFVGWFQWSPRSRPLAAAVEIGAAKPNSGGHILQVTPAAQISWYRNWKGDLGSVTVEVKWFRWCGSLGWRCVPSGGCAGAR